MSDTLIFQHIYPKTVAAGWLELTRPRSERYCAAHGIDFQCLITDPPHPKFRRRGHGHWAVPYYLHEFLQAGYENVIYLDHDTIIADMAVDLRSAIVPNKIGAVWHDRSQGVPDLSHYNVGALYVSNTPAVRAFVEKWLGSFPGRRQFPWWEQGVFNLLGTQAGIIERLDNRWNAENGVSPSEHPVVLGFHGFPDRLANMRLALAEVEAQS